MAAKRNLTLSLSFEALQMLEDLAIKAGLSKSAYIETTLRAQAAQGMFTFTAELSRRVEAMVQATGLTRAQLIQLGVESVCNTHPEDVRRVHDGPRFGARPPRYAPATHAFAEGAIPATATDLTPQRRKSTRHLPASD